MPELSLAIRDLVACEADVLVIGVVPDGSGARAADGLEALDKAFGSTLDRALTEVGATGRSGDLVRLPSLGAIAARTVLGVGIGSDPLTADALRDLAGTAVRALTGTASVAFALPANSPELVRAVAEGASLGAYAFDDFRDTDKPGHKGPVQSVTVLVDDPSALDLTAVAVLAQAVHLARDLVNTPPQALGPAELADRARLVADELGLACEVLDTTALREGGYGGLLAVGQGSRREPCLVRLDHTHPAATTTLSLVGKGITFDSGGLSLKPGKSMETMKMDMGGAAAVLAAVSAIAGLGLAVNVTGWLACAENMPSGDALRPSDVITQYGGTTVEVMNTDAEGRLVLADAIARSSEDRPDVIVDVATLTGAVISALGGRTIGIMGNDDQLREQLVSLAGSHGELAWPLPLPEHLLPSMESKVADMTNIGEANGGALSAGLFLKRFVGDGIRWAHLDIAGPAFNSGTPYGCTPSGGTGAAVRTLVALATALAAR